MERAHGRRPVPWLKRRKNSANREKMQPQAGRARLRPGRVFHPCTRPRRSAALPLTAALYLKPLWLQDAPLGAGCRNKRGRGGKCNNKRGGRKPTNLPCSGMVGADLRAARCRPSKGTARPEVGPYRIAAQARRFLPDNPQAWRAFCGGALWKLPSTASRSTPPAEKRKKVILDLRGERRCVSIRRNKTNRRNTPERPQP